MRAWHNGCALGFNPSLEFPIQLSGFDSRRSLQRYYSMAKHFYNIPLNKALLFIKENKSILNRCIKNTKEMEYFSILGKSYYQIKIEEFINFFKINKDIDYALKTLSFFNSILFLKEISKKLNFEQFKLEENSIDVKKFFYCFSFFYIKEEREFSKKFFKQMFLYYHSSFNKNTKINIDYQKMALNIAKSKKVDIKNSFGEKNENESYFTIMINNQNFITLYGKKIKTLRKKAYKRLFYYLIDIDETEFNKEQIEVIDNLYMLKSL
jgi:hypothetical protein